MWSITSIYFDFDTAKNIRVTRDANSGVRKEM